MWMYVNESSECRYALPRGQKLFVSFLTLTLTLTLSNHRTKTQSIEAVKIALARIKNIWGYSVKMIQLDGEKSLQGDFEELLNELGILNRRSAPDTPEHQGRMCGTKSDYTS